MNRALLAVVTVAAGAILSGVAPAVAIETTSFGIDVATRSDDQRLHIPVRAGETSTGELRVWNKQDTPLRLAFSVAPARVDDEGRASLGGDEPAVEWLSIEPASLELDAGAERIVEVRVHGPRKLEVGKRTVAVLAQPAVDGDAPAVLQRLAITTFLEPDEDSLIASLGVFPWIAAAILLLSIALLARRVRSKRPEGDPGPPPGNALPG